MYNINDIESEYRRLDKIVNLDTSNINIKLSTKSVNRLGSCRSIRGVPASITIADFVLQEKDLFYDVIRHEYAHAITKLRYPKEKHGHDSVWQKACKEVGCNPSRISEIESNIVKTIQENKKKYIVKCSNCGKEYTYYRKSNVVKALENGEAYGFYCGGCSCRSLKLIYT